MTPFFVSQSVLGKAQVEEGAEFSLVHVQQALSEMQVADVDKWTKQVGCFFFCLPFPVVVCVFHGRGVSRGPGQADQADAGVGLML